MKITSVELHPEGSTEVAVLSFRDPRRLNPYNVKGIVGLDADDIVPRYYGVSGTQKFYNLSLQARDLVLRVELNPDFSSGQSFSSLRDTMYRMIASSRSGLVEVQFKDNLTTVAVVSGFVSKLETPHFNKNPELQITIKCSDPMLRAPSPVVVDTVGLDPSLTIIEDNLSTAPHGIKFEISVTTQRDTFKMRDSWGNWSFLLTPATDFLVGDVLHISSEHNDKYVYIKRGTTTIHLADKMAASSVWPAVFPGANEFVLVYPTYFSWKAISYRPAYWGV